MRALFLLVALIVLTATVAVGASAQTPQPSPASPQGDASITPNGAMGEVKAIDPNSKQLIVKTDAGALVTVTLGDKTIYMRLAPGEKTLTNAE